MVSFDEAARRQLGLLTDKQLADLGITGGTLARELGSGRLVRMRTRVVRVAGAPVTEDQALLAAVLSTKVDVVVARLSGARVLRFGRYPPPDRIDLLTTSASVPRMEGVHAHRTLWLPPADRTVVGRVPVTSAPRTFIDTSNLVSFEILKKTARDLQRADRRFIMRLAACYADVPVSGRRPSAAVREILGIYVPGFDPGDSDPEFDIAELARQNGYPEPEMGIRIEAEGQKHRIDVGWRPIKTGFEYQSKMYHLDPIAAEEDDAKLRRLKRAGWDIWPVRPGMSKVEILSTLDYIFRPDRPLPT